MKYTVGIDFGTLSARALLVDVNTGKELAASEFAYPHKVIEDELPDGTKLGVDWALQHPQDYLDALSATVKDVLAKSNVSADDVVGIGIDFTSCTILPVKSDSTPLCFLSEYKSRPHAYAMLWKHHAAQYCADILNETAKQRREKWLDLYGGRISSEWLIPKAMQIAKEALDIYKAADKIIEAGDWIVWKLCGKEVRSACNAGYKALWHHKYGYPSNDFLKALDPLLENLVSEKLSTGIAPLGACAGYLTREAAELTGLRQGTAVAVGIIDAHASVPACGIDGPGKMLMIMGTSTCHMLLSESEKLISGICGVVKDGILPGFYAYEAGQSCVGDHFSWFIDNCLPRDYYDDAEKLHMNAHQYLRAKAEKLKAGESGLVALDWWNGVRSVLMDFDLTGTIVGLTLATKPEEIYRALIEATAYGTRRIIEAFEQGGVNVNELYATGGIAVKDPLTMQIYADVCGRQIQVCKSSQSGALGSAILAAAAAGSSSGGYDTVFEAIAKMAKKGRKVYRPIKENTEVYNLLYREYLALSEYFGRGGNDVMKRLKKIKAAAKAANL